MSKLLMAVQFDKDTGKVRRITSPPVDYDNHILVPFKLVEPIMDGKESKRSYRVLFDVESKSYQLTKIGRKTSTGIDINLFHYEVPKSKEDCDLLITQSLDRQCWEITIDNVIRENLINFKTNETIHLSITKPGDIHILYRYINLSFDLLKDQGTITIPFTMDFEKDMKPVSIYTSKRFKTYGHRIEQ